MSVSPRIIVVDRIANDPVGMIDVSDGTTSIFVGMAESFQPI